MIAEKKTGRRSGLRMVVRKGRRDGKEWRLAAICRVGGHIGGAPEKHAAGSRNHQSTDLNPHHP